MHKAQGAVHTQSKLVLQFVGLTGFQASLNSLFQVQVQVVPLLLSVSSSAADSACSAYSIRPRVYVSYRLFDYEDLLFA